MKIKSKLAQSTRRLVSRLAVNARTVPVVKDVYVTSLTLAGLALAITADLCDHYEKVLDKEYMRSYNETIPENKGRRT